MGKNYSVFTVFLLHSNKIYAQSVISPTSCLQKYMILGLSRR